MTASTAKDRIEDCVRRGDARGVATALAQLDEPERAALSAWARRFHRQVMAEGSPWEHGRAEQIRAAGLAVIGTIDAKALPRRLGPFPHDLVVEVLRGRPRAFRDAFVAGELSDFALQRQLVRDGLATRPETPHYWLGLLRRHGGRKLRDVVLGDPALLDVEVWKLFEIEGTAEDNLFGFDRFHKGQGRWHDLLLELARDGRLDRARLLAASLGALERGFVALRATWFHRFFDALEPTADEDVAFAPRYVALLRSVNANTATWALGRLQELQRAGRMPAAALAHLPALLLLPSGAVGRRVLAMLDAAGDDLEPGVLVRALLPALSHPRAAVQEAVAKRIAALWPRAGGDRALAAALRDAAATCRPTVQKRLAASIDVASADLQPGAADVAAALPRIDVDADVAPVATVDDLQLLCARVVEDPADPIDVERMLDGLLRMGAAMLGTEAGRTLVRRAERIARRGPVEYADEPWPMRGAISVFLCALGGVAIGAEGESSSAPAPSPPSPLRFVTARAELVLRTGGALALPLLSLPTQARGFVDAVTLARRVAQWQGKGVEPDPVDLALALLRLRRGDVGAAERAIRSTRGEPRALLFAAIGKGPVPATGTADLWLAALRGQRPHDDLSSLPVVRRCGGPDGRRAAVVAFAATAGPHGALHLTVDVEPAVTAPANENAPEPAPAPLPVALWHAWSTSIFEARPHGTVAQLARLWPANLQPFFAQGVQRLGSQLKRPEAQWENRSFVEPLLWPGVALGPAGHALLAVAMASAEPGIRGLAVDAAIAAIGEDRLTAAALADTLRTVLVAGLAPCRRVVASLTAVAGFGPRHGNCVRDLVAGMLSGAPAEWPRDLVALLELLLELATAHGAPPAGSSAASRTFLAAVPRGSGAGRVAARIATLDGEAAIGEASGRGAKRVRTKTGGAAAKRTAASSRRGTPR